jgi:methyl-accepting chemotaxis protein
MKLSTKLYGTVGSLGLIGMLVAGTGIWYLRALGEELSIATGKTAVKLDLVNASRARSWEMVAALRGMYLFASQKDQQNVEASFRRFDAAYKRTGEQIREVRPLIVTEQGKRDLDRFDAAVREFDSSAVEYTRICRGGHLEQITRLIPVLQAFTVTTEDALNSLRDQLRGMLKESQRDSEALRAQSMTINLAMSGLLLAIVGIAGTAVIRVNRTLVTATCDLSEGAEQVSAAARQVSSASQSLAQGSSEQAASLQETSASTEEIHSMARKNSENSGTATGLVTRSQQKFVEANQSLDQMLVAVADINAQSDKIAKIIKVIDEIAFQTNILALNAAVEAARAGEAGMGFAVVADEVRNLAQRCAQAARDTTGLIEESIVKSKEGKAKVDQVASAIRHITSESSQVKTLVEEVSLGSREQARGIEQIGKAIVQMEQVTQATAANAEESAAAAEELDAQAMALKDIVRQLEAMVGGGQEVDRGKAKPDRPMIAVSKRPAAKRPAPASSFQPARKPAAQPQPAETIEDHAPMLPTQGSNEEVFPLEGEFHQF